MNYDEMNYDEMEPLLLHLLRNSKAAFQRRVALRHGVRECSELWDACTHSDWNIEKQWCNSCGITKSDIVERRSL